MEKIIQAWKFVLLMVYFFNNIFFVLKSDFFFKLETAI